MVRSCLLAMLTVFLFVDCVSGQFIPRKQTKLPGPPLSAEAAVAKMTVPEGFSVEIVAAEPDIVNPVAMTFDERGRVWVTESFEYPRSSAGPGRDRVKVLEDTDGDGRMDKVTVFAEGLNIPSGIAVGYGGVWVANSPDILFLQDTDGDGKADKKEVVVTGFGRTDTHELPNSLTWGPDGYLYGLNGVFNYCHVEHRGKTYDFTCALFRINPRTRDFEIFAEGTSNPWGIAWDPEGSAFLSACVIDHLWHLTESGYYHRQGGPYPPFTWKLESIVKHKHQLAAYCGIHYFDSDAYPEKYRDRLYMGNIHGGCINVDELERDGATYFARPNPDFLTANDVWFMPVAQKTGPDGCLYVLDWYDRYHCYQDARRDPEGIERAKGRLYRIRYKQTPRVAKFDMGAEADDRLIERLHSKNVYERDVAQRLLSERNDEGTRPKLESLVFDKNAPRKTRLHALWSLVGTGQLTPAFLTRLLVADDASFRAWGVRAAGNMRNVPDLLTKKIASMARDASPDVQVQVAVASVKIEGMQPIPVLVDVLNQCGDDKLIPHIVWQNLHPLMERQSGELLAIVERADLSQAANLAGLMPRVIDRILGAEKAGADSIVKTFGMLRSGKSPNIAAARKCLTLLAARVQSRELSRQELAGLETPLQEIIAKGGNDPLYLDSVLLATSWGDLKQSVAARSIATSGEQSSENRLAALTALISGEDASTVELAAKILANRPRTPLTFRSDVLGLLGRSDDPGLAKVVLASYETMEPELQPRAIELLTQRTVWSRALLAAIADKQVPAAALNVNQVRKLLVSGDKQVVAAVTAQWGTLRTERNPDREKMIAKMRTFIRKNPGDPFAGVEVFKKVCGQCHKIYGEGQEVGPEITLNGRGSFEQLLSNVFDPSLVIGASYQARSVITTDGRVLTGLVVEDSPQRLVLKIEGGKLETIARKDIDELQVSKLSMMPEDLETQIKPTEMADLFAYLTLDKPPGDSTARQLPGVREIRPRATTRPIQYAGIINDALPGFSTKRSGQDGVALLTEHRGRTGVLRTHPVNKTAPCVLTRTVEVPAGKKTLLLLDVSHDPRGDWKLLVMANGTTIAEHEIGSKTTRDGWLDLSIDLSRFAGESVKLELRNAATGWSWEHAYWGRGTMLSR